jgi:hypothetical protein
MVGEIEERILERGGGLDGQTIVGGPGMEAMSRMNFC